MQNIIGMLSGFLLVLSFLLMIVAQIGVFMAIPRHWLIILFLWISQTDSMESSEDIQSRFPPMLGCTCEWCTRQSEGSNAKRIKRQWQLNNIGQTNTTIQFRSQISFLCIVLQDMKLVKWRFYIVVNVSLWWIGNQFGVSCLPLHARKGYTWPSIGQSGYR